MTPILVPVTCRQNDSQVFSLSHVEAGLLRRRRRRRPPSLFAEVKQVPVTPADYITVATAAIRIWGDHSQPLDSPSTRLTDGRRQLPGRTCALRNGAILFRVYGAEPGLTTEPLKLRLAHFPGGSNIQTSHDFSQKS
jgi:LmbE family N-acetylglucosaminyl deacetylase|eukprot:COSAG01_NODE_9440_length_2446_cov_27.467405_2_plen_137_part_00